MQACLECGVPHADRIPLSQEGGLGQACAVHKCAIPAAQVGYDVDGTLALKQGVATRNLVVRQANLIIRTAAQPGLLAQGELLSAIPALQHHEVPDGLPSSRAAVGR